MKHAASPILALMLPACAVAAPAVRWQHPAGSVTLATIEEVRAKLASQEWARRTYAGRLAALDRWAAVPSERLRSVFPKKRGNVYHNFSCPADRCRLAFDPFTSDSFQCPTCGKAFAPETDPSVYKPADRYHGTMWDGWACLFYLEAPDIAADMGLAGRLEGEAGRKYLARGVEILMLFADTIEPLKTTFDKDRQMSVLLTYHREGDNKVLDELARAYELLRDSMTPPQRERFERVVLKRMLDDIMFEPIYTYNHNNLYQWHRTIIQLGLTLEREDLIDWSFGYGAWDPQRQPEHRSVRRLVATHFKPDGAYWEMCSGYHLYPLHAFCELAVLSRNLSAMAPARFPPERYDLTDRRNDGGEVIRRALHWFMSMAMPDRTMPTIGDSMAPRAGMEEYYTTAEVGYRYFDLKAVGDYEQLRKGRRTWAGLLCGAPTITEQPTPHTSSFLSSGWVSLRSDWNGNRSWVGLNALIPGGGHQHADRLTLLTYSRGELLALEKATPYNEATTRELGTLTCSHNTVVVDRASQTQGESLTAAQTPKVAHFSAGPVARFAELRADHLYPQTRVYRRSVALIEDVVLDLFRVEGGQTHDWIVHHAGTGPTLSATTRPASFQPADWLYNGTDRVSATDGTGAWNAEWKVNSVTSRMTMAGAAGTVVYSLETYPVANAVITPTNPPCRTLCVRREGGKSTFLAVWDAWSKTPNLSKVVFAGGTSLAMETEKNQYHAVFGPQHARFAGDTSIESDGVFAIVRNTDAAMLVGGTRLAIRTAAGELIIRASGPATVSAEYADGIATIEVSGDIAYDTYGGADHCRDAPKVEVVIEGDLWSVREKRFRRPDAAK